MESSHTDSPVPRIIHSRDTILSTFEQFRGDIDDHIDRRERLIKSSRDITNLSKKVIFLLHRMMTDDAGLDDTSLGHRAATRAEGNLKEIQCLFSGMRQELAGENFARYRKNVSPGLQEYIEALSFTHYLEHKSLISYAQVQGSLCDDDGRPYFPLPLEDYLLGLSDLTGELMRFAIAAISRRGERLNASDVCNFVRGCKADFEGLAPYYKELRKKQQVTGQSLEKIEYAAYAIAVRTLEYDLPPEILNDLVVQVTSRAVDMSDFGEDAQRERTRKN